MQAPVSSLQTKTGSGLNTLRRLMWLAFAFAAADAFIPFAPFMPAAGLDPSWMYGMNQAVGQGLSFGRDVIFTFGPYASVFTKTFDPASVTRMILGSAYLATVFLGCFHIVARGAPARSWAMLGFIIALSLSGSDSLLLCLPLLVGAASFKLAREPDPRVKQAVILALAFGALGLLPLIKGSLLPLCGLVSVLCFAHLFMHRGAGLAAISLAAPLTAMGLLWLCVSEAASSLPNYLSSMKLMVSGFSEAMAVSGPVRELLLFTIPALLMLVTLAAQGSLAKLDRLFLLGLYAAFLFISFKAGFVRQDVHVRIALCNLLVALIVLLLVVAPAEFARPKLLIVLLATTALSSAYLVDRSLRGQTAHAGATSNPLLPRVLALDTRPWLAQFEAARRILSTPCAEMNLPGSVDIYSYEQACFIARGWNWNPRPVMQSYAAYMPGLARLNEAHLRGPESPQSLVYKLQTIDNRVPALDDGLSLPAMLDNYALTQAHGRWMQLTRKAQLKSSSRYDPIATLTASLGQTVAVPAALPLYVEITIQPTRLGRFTALAYKPPMLTLRATLASGETISHRVNSNMMVTGFFLSPWLADNEDVAALFEGKAASLQGKAVKALSIHSSSSLPLWQAQYTISFKRYLY